ncbi:MAG: hypothetical protein HFI63_06735 [Lachnospiraceae bacterium]|nr:hypothetical protein [Lachnospiraceae bacterium]
MKKLFLFCLTAALFLSGCGTKKEKSLYVQGLEIISLMGEMTQSDAYFDMFSSAPEVKAQVEGIARAASAGVYQQPKAVYQITADTSGLMKLLESTSDANVSFDGMSQELKAYIQSRLFISCASILNSTVSIEAIAASSIYMCGKSFVCHETTENMAYLYTYEEACPVLVTFSVGENSAISASGSYILNSDIENLTDFFDLSGFQVEELKVR